MDRKRRRVSFNVDIFSGFRLLGKPLYYLLFLALPSFILLISDSSAGLNKKTKKIYKKLLRKVVRSVKQFHLPKIYFPKIVFPPKLFIGTALSFIIAAFLLFFYFYFLKGLPTPYDLKNISQN